MAYETFGTLLEWIAAPSGKTVKDNRCDLVTLANRIRQHTYLLYESTPLWMDGEECFLVEKFPLDCNCSEFYHGITLPAEYETVEAIWLNDAPIKMFDKWREYRTGIKDACSCKLGASDVESFFPTERELSPCGKCCHVKFKAEDCDDIGKILIVRYIDSNGQDHEDSICLANHYVKTSRRVLMIKPRGGVILPKGMVGSITVADETGQRILSSYSPFESVPSYRRIKINDVCCGDQVLVKASRRFHPLFFDTDVIETDNRLAYEELAKFFRFNDSKSADGAFALKASNHAINGKNYLLGEKSRHRGKGTITQVRLNHGPKNRSGLRSKSLGHRHFGLRVGRRG